MLTISAGRAPLSIEYGYFTAECLKTKELFRPVPLQVFSSQPVPILSLRTCKLAKLNIY